MTEPPGAEGVGLEYPTLIRRYLTLFIDGILVLASMFAVTYLLPAAPLAGVRVAIVFGMVFAYEPLLTSRSCTLGQYLLGIRVRSYPGLGRIGFGQAYVRIVVKILLGWISFFAVSFNPQRRAIHDMAGRSVVLRVR